MDELAAHKKPFAHDYAKCTDFVEAIKMIKPTGIIGVAAQPRTFTTEVLEEMSKLNERPIIFALSNPTSRAECTAEEAYRVTKGKALYASGSPFAPVEYEGKTFVPRQGNNSYVFPALGLGAVFSRSKWMPDGMFLVAGRARYGCRSRTGFALSVARRHSSGLGQDRCGCCGLCL